MSKWVKTRLLTLYCCIFLCTELNNNIIFQIDGLQSQYPVVIPSTRTLFLFTTAYCFVVKMSLCGDFQALYFHVLWKRAHTIHRVNRLYFALSIKLLLAILISASYYFFLCYLLQVHPMVIFSLIYLCSLNKSLPGTRTVVETDELL